MKESTKNIINENNIPIEDLLFNMAEQEFMDDPDWEDEDARIFTVLEKNESTSKKYKVSIIFDPYFSIKTEEYVD